MNHIVPNLATFPPTVQHLAIKYLFVCMFMVYGAIYKTSVSLKSLVLPYKC